MKTEDAAVTALGGLAVGIVGALTLSPSYKTAAAWATSNPKAIGLAKGVLQQNGIAYAVTSISDVYGLDQSVSLQGPPEPSGGRRLYILLVKEADQARAGSLIQDSQ